MNDDTRQTLKASLSNSPSLKGRLNSIDANLKGSVSSSSKMTGKISIENTILLTGGYYIPSVSENGDLSWTPSKEDMPSVVTTNVCGDPGEDGYTPIRGVDYFTDADKSEMVQAVISALPVYNGEVEAV